MNVQVEATRGHTTSQDKKLAGKYDAQWKK